MNWLDKSKFDKAPAGVFPFSVSLLSWAYNEEESIEEFLFRSKALMDSLEIEYEHVLIDDCSTDRTGEIARRVQQSYPQLRILKNEKNMNVGWSAQRAFREAKKDILFWQTVDWSYDISRIKSFLWQFRKYDVVHGVRIELQTPKYSWLYSRIPFLKKIKVSKRSDNLWKAIVSVTNYLLIRTLFRLPLLDFQNVTFLPTKLVQSIEFESHSSFTSPELLYKSYWQGASILQVPIAFIARQKGTAKGTKPGAIFAAVRQLLHSWVRWQLLGLCPHKTRGHIVAPLEQDIATLNSPAHS